MAGIRCCHGSRFYSGHVASTYCFAKQARASCNDCRWCDLCNSRSWYFKHGYLVVACLSRLAGSNTIAAYALVHVSKCWDCHRTHWYMHRHYAALRAICHRAYFLPAGRMTLTLYIAHILLGMGTLEAMGWLQGQGLVQVAVAASVYCIVAILFAWCWTRYVSQGPLEWLMRRITR